MSDELVPEGFFAIGIKNAGGSEYVFAMWRRDNRRFWFQDQYVNFQGSDSASCSRTHERIRTALAEWDGHSTPPEQG